MSRPPSSTAVCIRCGSHKERPPNACANCGFAPSSQIDLAKSFILSQTFDVGETTIGRPLEELAEIAKAIAAGSPFAFEEAEIQAVAKEVAAFRAITPRRLFADLIKWVGPPLLILVLAYVLLNST